MYCTENCTDKTGVLLKQSTMLPKLWS